MVGGDKQKKMCPYQILNLPNTRAPNSFSFALLNQKNENLGNQMRAKSGQFTRESIALESKAWFRSSHSFAHKPSMVPFAHGTKSKLLSLMRTLAQFHIPRLLILPWPCYLLATVTISPEHASSSMTHSLTHSAKISAAFTKRLARARP